MTANNFYEIKQCCKAIYLILFKLFTMSKKLPVILNFRCNLKMAECCLLCLATNLNQFYDKLYNSFNPNLCVSCCTVISSKITFIFLNKKIISLYAAADANILLTWNALEFVIRSIGSEFYLVFHFQNELVTC